MILFMVLVMMILASMQYYSTMKVRRLISLISNIEKGLVPILLKVSMILLSVQNTLMPLRLKI